MFKEKKEKDNTRISIPTSLAKKLNKRLPETGFESLSSYVTYILNQVLSNIDETTKNDSLNKEDEEKVKERLRALGYLD